jgi:hypothetical protein
MAPKRIYPHSNAECEALLTTLGFRRKIGIGRGKHPIKYEHPTRLHIGSGDKPFVLITHNFFEQIGKRLMKKLLNWGFTQDEIEQACRGIAPSGDEVNTDPEVDIEPGSA